MSQGATKHVRAREDEDEEKEENLVDWRQERIHTDRALQESRTSGSMLPLMAADIFFFCSHCC
jgi:hypothetical protein